MKLSVIIPSLTGEVPKSVEALGERVELVVVKGMSPVSAARNEGLRRATGEYIAWVDADDEIAPEWLAEIEKALADGPDIVNVNVQVVWEDSSRPDYDVRSPYAAGAVDPARYFDDYRCQRIGGQLWGKVFRRTLFEGVRFEGAQYEEQEALAVVLPRVRSVVHLDKTLYVYRRRKSGLSQCANGSEDIRRIIRFAEKHPEWSVGVCQMATDYLRHSTEAVPEVRTYLRRNLVRLFVAKAIPLRLKVKSLLAAFGF